MLRTRLPVYPLDQKAASPVWQAELGFWQDGAGYQITREQATVLKNAVATLTACYAEALDRVVHSEELLREFFLGGDKRLNEKLQNLAAQSWRNTRERSFLFDRWDLAWNGGDPKLLERNTGYIGMSHLTGVAQSDYVQWLRGQKGFADVELIGDMKACFIAAMREVANDRRFDQRTPIVLTSRPQGHWSYDAGMAVDEALLGDWIEAAGFIVERTASPMPKGFFGFDRFFGGNNVADFYKKLDGKALFPFSDMENFIHHQALSTHNFPYKEMLAPAWMMLAGNKRFLPLLWEMFPGHPNLLPATYDNKGLIGMDSIVKFCNGAQTMDTSLLDRAGRQIFTTHGHTPDQYGNDNPNNYISQAYCADVKNPDNSSKVVHVFTANGVVAGAGVRESAGTLVGGYGSPSRFAPLITREHTPVDAFLPIARPADPKGLRQRGLALVERMIYG